MDTPLEEHHFDEAEVQFWHSDEKCPFLRVFCDTLKIFDDRAEIWSRDYHFPVCVIAQYDYWRQT